MTPSEIERLRPFIKHITWHWSAGLWHQTFDHYHFCVTFDPATKKAGVVQTLTVTKPGEHTWHRNTGNIGLSLMGMGRDSRTGKIHTIQDQQMEAAAKATAELCHLFGLPLDAVHDHAYWATQDGYGPGSGNPETRVDIGPLEPVLRRKAAWYLQALGKGTHKPEFTTKLF